MRYVIAMVLLVLSFVPAAADRPYNNGMNYNKAYPDYRPHGQATQRRARRAPQRQATRQRAVTRSVYRQPAQSAQARLSPAIAREPAAQIARGVVQAVRTAVEILPHPAGCRRDLFCGCGVSVRVFGKPVNAGGLAVAGNWLKFPRAAPGPGMVAANHRHVMYIEAMVGPGRALVYNPNSGRGLTRRHVVSLAGYQIVNPHGAYAGRRS